MQKLMKIITCPEATENNNLRKVLPHKFSLSGAKKLGLRKLAKKLSYIPEESKTPLASQ